MLISQILVFCCKIQVKVNDSTLDTKIPALLVDNVLKNNPSDQKIVLLIDEYDTPLSAVLNNEKEWLFEHSYG